MKKLFDDQSPLYQSALKVVFFLQREGYKSYFAGGAVRDALLGYPIKDIDIATSALPGQVIDLFDKTIEVGIAFGVVIVRMDSISFEVTTFRSDGDYLDGRRPISVTFESDKEDALRRDFTINGLFYDPSSHQVIDYVNGQEDLKNSIVRCIGNPSARFSEDKLRILRAIRFASRYEFDIEKETWLGICEFASSLRQVSQERIGEELKKMIEGQRFSLSLEKLNQAYLIPEVFGRSISYQTLSFFENPSLSSQQWTLSACLSFLAICESWTIEIVDSVVSYLSFPNRVKKECHFILSQYPHSLKWGSCREGERLYKAYHSLFPLLLKVLYSLVQINRFSHSLYDKMKEDYCRVEECCFEPYVTGQDLLEHGWLPSSELGEMLLEMTYLQLEGVIQSRQQALERLRQCQK